MGHDPTELVRREMVRQINLNPGSREALEEAHGQVWDSAELIRDYDVHGFMAPFVAVTRISDNKPGMLEFQHMPRFYYNFMEHSK